MSQFHHSYMNKLKFCFLCLLTFLNVSSLFSQNQLPKTEGVVFDTYKLTPIAGALVNITGLSSSVTTDSNGKFSVQTPNADAEITVSFPGYYTHVQPLLSGKKLNIFLIPDYKKSYSDVILLPVRGEENIRNKQTNLFSVQKSDIGGTVTETEQILSLIPGVEIIGKSGMPGEGSYYNVRGSASFTASTSPLVVVNGIPYMPDMNESGIIGGFSKNVFNFLNPKDVKNITVLKGSDATLYGSLGSNGVILIETDKATDLDTKVEFSTELGIDVNQSRLPVMGVTDFKNYIGNVALTKYDDMAKVLETFPFLVDDPNYYYKYLYNNNTVWQNLIYAPGITTDNVLKIKGGDAIAKYDVSIGYKNKGGQLKNSGFSKYYARLNSDVNLSRKISFYSSISMAYMDYNVQEQGLLAESNPMLAAMKKGPIFSPYKKDADNNLLPDFAPIRDASNNLLENNMVSNPLALLSKVSGNQHDYDIHINGGLIYKMNENFTVNGVLGLYYNYSRQNMFLPGVTEKSIMPLFYQLANNTVRSAQGFTFNTYYNVNANYRKTIDRVHKIDATAGFQIARNYTEYDAGTGYNTANDFYKTLGYVSSVSRNYFGYNHAWNWLNLIASVKYDYKGIIGAGLSTTFDASSATGADASLFQVYPALNVVWNTKNTDFYDADFINKLNVRAEFAVTGNSRFSSSLSKYYYINKVYRELSGLTLAGIPNTEIIPETKNTLNFGIDASLFNHRLDITADVYRSMNHNLIMPVSVSAAYGTDFLYKNAASAVSTGYELGISYAALVQGDFKWNIGASVAGNRNSVSSLGGQNNLVFEMADGSALISEIGKPLYSFYGYQTTEGNVVFATTEQAQAAVLKNSAGKTFRAGDVHFVDKNSDGVIDDRDRVHLGSADPKMFGRIFTSLEYKNFALMANFGYSYGNMMYNAVRRNMESMSNFTNQLTSVNKRWMSEGQNTFVPRAEFADPMGNNRFSDRWIENASFLKLKELALSYKFNFMEGTTVYLSADNIFTITEYLGLDPETMYSYDASLRGFDYAKIPLPRSFKLGFNIKL